MKSLRFVFVVLSLVLLVSDNVRVFSAPLKTSELVRDRLFRLKELEGKAKIKVFCDFCSVAVDTIRKLAELKTSEKLIEYAVAKVCETMHIEDHYVCSSIVPVFKDEVLYVFDNTALSTREICGTVLNGNCGQTYDPFNQTWSIPIPGGKPPVVPPSPPKAGSPTNRILHLSDIHWDPNYTVGLTTQCGEPICCRPPNAKATGSEDYAHQWGSYSCDLAYPTFINLLDHLNQTADQFEWIYLTGDLPAHNDWEQNKTGQLYILNTIVNQIKTHLPGKPIFFSIGNHESAPVNSFPPPFIPEKYSDAWLYDAAADLFKEWLSEDAIKTFKYAGFFSIDYKGFRIISLQTNFCNNGNWWLLINDTDPANMLQWFVHQLSDAETKGLKVHILGHMPPDKCLKSWVINYQKIILRYENVIAGQFFGHVHIDSFRVMLDIQNNIARPFGIIYLGPGVTTAGNMNPGYRIYTVDGTYNGSSRQVLDHETYYMNLTDANLTNKPKWNFEYSAKKSYNLSDFSANSWFNLVKRFQSDHNIFLNYYHYQFKMANPTAQCNGGCESYNKCSLLTTYTKDNVCQFLNPKTTISNYDMMAYSKSVQYC